MSMDELDRATDAIGFARIGSVRFEGNSFIISSGRHEFLKLRSSEIKNINPSLELKELEAVANQTISRLGPDAVSQFNELEVTLQFRIVDSLSDLYKQVDHRSWDDEREDSIRAAIEAFARSCLSASGGIHLSGAVNGVLPAVEKYVKHALRRIVEAVYGRNYKLAQNELKLPTKDFRKMTLGKTVTAFRTMKEHEEFRFLDSAFDDDWLDRLDRFTDLRNTWAHGSVPTTHSDEVIIDEARRAIVESIELIRWIGESVLPVTPEAAVREKIQLPDQRGDRDLGIFISYSSTDKNVAEQIASVLKGFKYNVFYAEWSISAGESIVNKINEGLAKNDILVILLSPESVNSRWVKKELDTALMRQLAGHQVQVVPVLITSCEIPTELLSIKYVDLTEDFQGNLMKLIQSLQDLTQRGETGP